MEYKFRAWDKENKQMVYRDLDTFAKFGCPFIPMQEAIKNKSIMQSIGAKDKKGKEYYYKDIVKHCFHDKDPERFPNGIVEFVPDNAAYGIKWGNNNDINVYIPWDTHEIIGNIYENGDLLNAT
jgi:uncharacterized phage protein (TIGR01671 family)